MAQSIYLISTTPYLDPLRTSEYNFEQMAKGGYTTEAEEGTYQTYVKGTSTLSKLKKVIIGLCWLSAARAGVAGVYQNRRWFLIGGGLAVPVPCLIHKGLGCYIQRQMEQQRDAVLPLYAAIREHLLLRFKSVLEQAVSNFNTRDFTKEPRETIFMDQPPSYDRYWTSQHGAALIEALDQAVTDSSPKWPTREQLAGIAPRFLQSETNRFQRPQTCQDLLITCKVFTNQLRGLDISSLDALGLQIVSLQGQSDKTQLAVISIDEDDD